jgi:ribose transport system permease protein
MEVFWMASTQTVPEAKEAAHRRIAPPSGSTALDFAAKYTLVLLLACVIVGFSLAKPETFGAWTNYRVTFDQEAPVLITAFAVMMPLIVGEFDLSVGANVFLGNMLVVGMVTRDGVSLVPALLITLAACTTVGFLNGLAVMKLRVNAFVATLATGTIIGGIALAYANNKEFFDAPASLTNLARGTIIGGIPNTIPFSLIVAVILLIVIKLLPVGRRMRAVGGNRIAAELTGISPFRFVIAGFTAGGFLAGIAGIMLGSQLGAATAGSNGALLLPAFAAAFLGSTTIEPGRFNVIGTVVAVAFLALTVTGLQLVGVQEWVKPVINGTALFVAVALSSWLIRLRIARLRHEQLQAIEGEAEASADAGKVLPDAV